MHLVCTLLFLVILIDIRDIFHLQLLVEPN